MTKQEEIREGMEKLVSEAYWYEGKRNIVVDIAKKMLLYLHSQGVVLKVDRELPETWRVTYSDPPTPNKAYEYGQSDGKQDMLKAGYVAVESLI